ncbi:Methyltransferase type 11 [uncultured Paludibacter sp.]|uniref:Methyltransferase type 11 n=1 Tax=uncultured Paludibacter sp. TaxID=497635 RepID=A0A653AKU0_9BACT|nr:Methyltransferase type 11 [uncultured Paludibacter sp.]
MSNENNTSVDEFDIHLICEYFSNTERQGPGSPEATLKALSFVPNLSKNSRIADIGCGTGGQTMILAQNTEGAIIGVDLFPTFIDKFNENVLKLNFQNRVTGIIGDMKNILFQEEELDLIWSEGAIYNIGFERGINEWRKFLKTGGHLAVTEATWFTNERPKEIEAFWKVYPEIDTISNKVAQMEKAGYVPEAVFIIPENCWTEHFFAPQKKAQEIFLEKYSGNQTAKNLIEYMRHEVHMYDKYKEFYGYVFYIGKKI